jgi:transcriptional regulator with XRE-family HTH domain
MSGIVDILACRRILTFMELSKRLRRPADVAQVIVSARRTAGLTQAQLAEQARVSRQWLSEFENGKTPGADLSKVLAVLVTLGVTTVSTFTVPDEEP